MGKNGKYDFANTMKKDKSDANTANTPDKHDISVYNYTLYKNAGF
jgi:hypothetical protein